MHILPPVANPVSPRIPRPWLPPVRFRAKPYLQFCRDFDAALRELESRYPSQPRPLSIELREKRLKKKPRPK
jgi:hypothetical protein